MNNLARASTGNTSTLDRDAVIREYASLVKTIALKLAMRLPPHIDVRDMISVGIAGLLEAIERFDPQKGVKIETFLSFRIQGAMLDELRRIDWMPRSIRQKAKHLQQEYVRAEARLGRAPTEKEMAGSMGMNEDEYLRFLQDASPLSVISLEDMGFTGDGDKRDILECLVDPNGKDPVVCLNLKETKQHLGKAIDELSEKERLVLSLYYYEDLNLKEIGNVMSLTESRVCQLHTQAITRLKVKMKRFHRDDLE